MSFREENINWRFLLACTLSSVATLASSQRALAQTGQHPVQPNVVGRYIKAIQVRDFKTVMDLSNYYQQEVEKIKAQNPRALWPKLVGEYYQDRIATFGKEGTYWQNYGESLGAMIGDPAGAIRSLQGLLPPECKSKITEARTDSVQDSMAFGPHQRTRVYVTVDYPSPANSPLLDQKLLRETILEFTVNAKTQLVMAVAKVPKADVYWTSGSPLIRGSIASRLYGAGLWDRVISELAPSDAANGLSAEEKDLLANSYFQYVRQRCFSKNALGQFIEFNQMEECLNYIAQAVRLKPEIGGLWANELLSVAEQNTESNNYYGFETAPALLDMASKYIAGDQQLQQRDGSLRLKVAMQRLRAAMDEYSQRPADSESDVSKALSLVPHLNERPEAYAMAVEQLKKLAADAQRGDLIGQYGLADTFQFMLQFHIPVRRQDVPEFLEWTKYAHDPAKTRSVVQQLASSNGVAMSGGPAQPSAGAASGYPGTASSSSADLASVRSGELPSVWDSTLKSGGTVAFQAWHYAGTRYQMGAFQMSKAAVSFIGPNGETVFSASPSQLSSLEAHHPPFGGESWSFGMKVGGHRFWFAYVPVGVECKIPSRCESPAAYSQEGVIANYVVQAIQKLAAGGTQ